MPIVCALLLLRDNTQEPMLPSRRKASSLQRIWRICSEVRSCHERRVNNKFPLVRIDAYCCECSVVVARLHMELTPLRRNEKTLRVPEREKVSSTNVHHGRRNITLQNRLRHITTTNRTSQNLKGYRQIGTQKCFVAPGPLCFIVVIIVVPSIVFHISVIIVNLETLNIGFIRRRVSSFRCRCFA